MNELNRIIEKCVGEDMPFCQAACPLHVDMKNANVLIRDGKYNEALSLIKMTLPFPAIMGRVCTHPCEDACKRKEIDEPLSIMCLKRSAVDYGGEIDWKPDINQEKDGEIAVIGSGPAGLMAAYELRKSGYQVTIFEALPVLGGMLAIGIPEFRLPRDIINNELNIMSEMGIQVKLNTRIGADIKMSEIRKDFDAVFIATGTQLSQKMQIEGSDLIGVIWGMDFLRNINLGLEVKIKDTVAVIGGGNVAIDVARTAIRLGAKKVTVYYRRSKQEMPAREDEIHEAVNEGIEIRYLVSPVAVSGEDGIVTGMKLTKMDLGEPDNSGRRRPIPVKGSEFNVDKDLVILATGQTSDLSFIEGNDEIRCSNDGNIIVNEVTLESDAAGIFAGGDVVTGPKTVIEALAAGKKAAISIDRYIKGEPLEIGREGEGPVESRLEVPTEGVDSKKRISTPVLSFKQRENNFNEVESGFSREQAEEEARRCLNCECKLCVKECEFLKLYCKTPKELCEKLRTGSLEENPEIPYSCNLCGLCKKICPQDLYPGDMCLEIREDMVAGGIGPLPEHELVRMDQEWVTSDKFALSISDSINEAGEWAFFPGCSLSAYSPDIVIKTYDYLREQLPGTGIILNCCGAPSHCIGDRQRFNEITNGLQSEMEKLGASGLIVACPECYYTIKHNVPEIKLKSLYEIMADLKLPEGIEVHDEYTFSLHDSCTVRDEKEFMDSVRDLVKRMGYEIEEMQYSREMTRCCGAGGMVPYVDLELYLNQADKRAGEASHDMLTYCASCRETFAATGKPSIHILDLLFNPEWQVDLDRPPQMGKERQERQSELKVLLLKYLINT
jgi:NADPH-dependent glutamate synthase beta subunit-like oxidoreductase